MRHSSSQIGPSINYAPSSTAGNGKSSKRPCMPAPGRSLPKGVAIRQTVIDPLQPVGFLQSRWSTNRFTQRPQPAARKPRTNPDNPSMNHVINPWHHRARTFEADRVRGLEVDQQVGVGQPLNGKARWFRARRLIDTAARYSRCYFGFHSRVSLSASAICAGVILAATRSRFLTANSRFCASASG
jgi:hypothetical protein